MNEKPLISDPRVFAIPIRENNESLIDLRKFSHIFLSDKKTKVAVVDNDVINTINSHFTLVRATVAERILQAEKLLPLGIKFLFEEGWRPLFIQKEIFTWYYNKLACKYPKYNKEQLYLETCKFVSPYDNTPAHSTGGAIDISLCDEQGNELEMGSSSDDPPELNEERGYTQAKNISPKAKKNRQILIQVLTTVGFVNYPYEWWHWSYGDRYWAYNSGASFAIYGSISK